MSCWVCDNSAGGELVNKGTYYFDEDFLSGGTMSISFCTHAYETNTRYVTFQKDLQLDGYLYAANVNSGTLAPGEHSPRKYTTDLSTIYDFCGFGEHLFQYDTCRWSFKLSPVRVFLFNNYTVSKEADDYAEYEKSGLVLSEGGYRHMVVKSGGSVQDLTVAACQDDGQFCWAYFYAGSALNRAYIGINSAIFMDEGSSISDTISVTGTLSAEGAVNAAGANITLNVKDSTPENPYWFVQGMSYFSGISSCSISVKNDQKTGVYHLANGFYSSSIKGTAFESISLNVDGAPGQYTFKWNAEEGKYTGVNYNGYNYVLSTENNKLMLSVTENKICIYTLINSAITAFSETEDTRKKEIDKVAFQEDACVYSFYFHNKESYIYVGNGCPEIIASQGPLGCNNSETDNLLLLSDHASGYYFRCYTLDSLGSFCKENNITICGLLPACLMASVETAYVLGKYGVKQIIATESLSKYGAADYTEIIDAVLSLSDKNASLVASEVYDHTKIGFFKSDTKSLLSAGNASNLVEKLNEFAEIIIHDQTAETLLMPLLEKSSLMALRYHDYMVDLNSFFINLQTDKKLLEIKNNGTEAEKSIIGKILTAIDNIKQSISEVVISTDSCDNAGGISCYMPLFSYQGELYGAGKYNFNPLSQTEWGFLVKKIYVYNYRNKTPIIKPDNSLSGVALGNGQTAANTGELSSGVGFAGETAYGDGGDNFYTVSLTGKGTVDDAISVTADSGASITLSVYDSAGTTLLKTASGAGQATVSLDGINAGTLVYSVSADKITSYDINYETDTDTGNDHLDLLAEGGNNTKATAQALSDGYYKGLVVNSANPDWYWIETVDAVEGTVGLWGGNIAEGNISATAGAADFQAYIDDALTNERIAFSWDAAAGMYVAQYSGEGYLYVGNKNSSSGGYNILCASIFESEFSVPGDLNGDGRADVIMSIVQSGHGAEGATGAWLIQEDQTAAWGDLSQRNEGWSIFGTGISDTGKTTNDVYIKSTGNVVGAWVTDNDGKVAGWQTVGEFDASTQVLGLGDFNGDGQSDLLLRNVNGAVGCHLTDGTGWNYFQSLGDEWKIAAVGDLNGDGRSDVVLKHDAGFAGSWLTQADGTMAWADLDTLPAGFEIVGAGDFDGDGTDDVLLKKDNYYGAWLVNNGNAAGWFGIGSLGNVAVEQIGDFDGDGVDDLRIRTSAGDLGALLVKGADTLEWKYYGSVGAEWSTSLAAI